MVIKIDAKMNFELKMLVNFVLINNYNLYINTQTMSIYSGLPTREDESNYNKLLLRLISSMQQHILQLCNGIIAPHFSHRYTKIIAKMETYEQHKYLPPKFSTILKPLQQAMRNLLTTKIKNQGQIQFNVIKLQAVKEQQDQITSPKQLNKYKTQLYMKRSLIRSKKFIFKQHLLTEPDLIQKDNKRARLVFSQKKPKLQTQFRNVEKLKARQTMSSFNFKRSQFSSSNGFKNDIKNNKMFVQINQKTNQDAGNKLIKALSQTTNKII